MLKVHPARLLCLHDAVELLEQSRHEPQCNRHHHRQLMHRDAHTAQRGEQRLQSIRQTQRACCEREQRTEEDEQDQPQPDICTAFRALPCRRKDTETERLRTRCHKEMHRKGKEHNPKDRPNRAQLHHERHLRAQHQRSDAYAEHSKSGRILHEENQQQEEEQQDNLYTGIHAVQK